MTILLFLDLVVLNETSQQEISRRAGYFLL
jgi:hypothetical protein